MVIRKSHPFSLYISKDDFICSVGHDSFLSFLYKSQLLQLKKALEKTIKIYDKNNLNDVYIENTNAKLLEDENKKYAAEKENIKTYIYLMYDSKTGYYKIGTSVNPINREKALRVENTTISLIFYFKALQKDEYLLHEKYKEFRIRREWFALSQDHVSEIESYLKSENKKYERRVKK